MHELRPELIAAIIRDAGGRIVGRTRLQKIAYLLEVTGYGDGFVFRYKHFGPYSHGVAESARRGALLGHLSETRHDAPWGGRFSIYEVADGSPSDASAGRRELAARAAEASAIELELAATAVFLSYKDHEDPWLETERRKPMKAAEGRLEKAKELLKDLREIEVKKPLPEFD